MEKASGPPTKDSINPIKPLSEQSAQYSGSESCCLFAVELETISEPHVEPVLLSGGLWVNRTKMQRCSQLAAASTTSSHIRTSYANLVFVFELWCFHAFVCVRFVFTLIHTSGVVLRRVLNQPLGEAVFLQCTSFSHQWAPYLLRTGPPEPELSSLYYICLILVMLCDVHIESKKKV